MKTPNEIRCVVCRKVFCCESCRRNHERLEHKLTYECPICREEKFICSEENLNNFDLVMHINDEHLPLHCNKCDQRFHSIEDLQSIGKCGEIIEDETANHSGQMEKCLTSLLEQAKAELCEDEDDIEAILSINPANKQAILTPIAKSRSKIFEEPSSSSNKRGRVLLTPFPKHLIERKLPKLRRSATPHVKKVLVRQAAREFSESKYNFDETNEDKENECSAISGVNNLTACSSTLSSKSEYNLIDLKTPTTNFLKESRCLAIASAVTTSTPTHPSTAAIWTPFSGTNADSPLSEIEGTTGDVASPSQSTDQDSPRIVSNEVTSTSKPKLKSIILTGSRSRIESQDSNERQPNVSCENSVESSSNIKKSVKFADDTKFENENINSRVFRKPKRMLTPGPQRLSRHLSNPRFQAILKRFENETGYSIVQTPNNKRPDSNTEETPEGEPITNNPARAIDFKLKSDSPAVCSHDMHRELTEKPILLRHNQIDTYKTTSPGNETFKSCNSDSQPSTPNMNNCLTAFSTNLAGSIQSYLSTVVNTCEETTEIDLKFIITKKKVSVSCMPNNLRQNEKENTQKKDERSKERGGIWSAIAKTIKNVLWRSDEETSEPETSSSVISNSSDFDSSSGSKRKIHEMLEPIKSPLNRKKYKYEKIKGRRPLHPNLASEQKKANDEIDRYIRKSSLNRSF